MTPDENAETTYKRYRGNCHCGAFRFSLRIPPLKQAKACNCSICARNGYLWIFVSPDNDLVIEKGEGTLREYAFGKKSLAHRSCPTCGTSVMARQRDAPPGRAVGINIRSLQEIDLDALEVETLKGADRAPLYEPPKHPPTLPEETPDGLKTYHGSCHCGAVTYTVTTKSLSETAVLSCNCSLCSRNGDLWVYPKKAAVNLQGEENLTDYAFLDQNSLHSFCSICGVSVIVKVLGKDGADNICPINVRTIEGIDVEGLTLNRYDGKKDDPQYVLRN